MRAAIEKTNIKKIQTLPEERPTSSPTWGQIQRLFANHSRQELTDSGLPVTTFWDELNPHQRKVVELMGVPMSDYTKK